MRLILLLALTTLYGAAWAADKVQTLHVKTGLWQVTTTSSDTEQLPIPSALLGKLTPEQRARVEERMNTRSSDAPRVRKRKYCLTKDQLNQGATFGQDRKSCTRTIFAATSDRLEMRIECASQRQQIKSAGTLQVEATDPENVKGSIRLTMGGDRPNDLTSMFTARWISQFCSLTK